MSASHIIIALCHVSAKHYPNWWKFYEVLTKTNLHSYFSETRCIRKLQNSKYSRFFLTHCVVQFVATFLSSGSLCRIYEFLFIEGVNLIFSLSLWVTLISLFVRLSRVAMQIAGCLIRTKLLPAVWCRMHTCMCAYEWLHMYSLQCLVYDAI